MNPTDRARHKMKTYYEKQIEEVFRLQEEAEKISKEYELIHNELLEAQKEARRIDELRNKVTK